MRAEPGEGGRFSWLIALNTSHCLTNGCYGSPPFKKIDMRTLVVLKLCFNMAAKMLTNQLSCGALKLRMSAVHSVMG